MKIVIVGKSNMNQPFYLTTEGKWEPRIKNAKDWDIAAAREKLKELSKTNSFVEIHVY